MFLKVEGLMMDIVAAEEEIVRWKTAAEQEAAAGRAVEQEFLAQVCSQSSLYFISVVYLFIQKILTANLICQDPLHFL